MRTAPLILVFLLALLIGAGNGKHPLNEKILAFCDARIGQHVGDGECGTFARAAATAAGARDIWKLTPRNETDYIWGKLVCTITPANIAFDGIHAGDIVQMRSVVIPGGWRAEHHTAIVKELRPDDQTLIFYEANVSGDGIVHISAWRIGGLKEGRMWFYRPIPR